MISCEAVGGNPADALHAAAAMELLHNFTLVHDDIMDHASLRRNRATVHERWDTNTAILAGDEMIALAYRTLLQTKSSRVRDIARVFTEAFVEVCEGQGIDKEFECRNAVTMNEYITMIKKKTARVISAAAEIGGYAGGGSAAQIRALRNYGEQIGIAFQMNDDLLDIMGDSATIGKSIGGDIAEGKKTFLLMHALAHTTG